MKQFFKKLMLRIILKLSKGKALDLSKLTISKISFKKGKIVIPLSLKERT